MKLIYHFCFSQKCSAPLRGLQVDGGELAGGAQGTRRPAWAGPGGARRELARVQQLLVQDPGPQVPPPLLLDEQQGQEAAPHADQVEGVARQHQGDACS